MNRKKVAVVLSGCGVYDGEESVVRAIQAMHGQGKPIAALCISPVMMAKILPGARVTIGQDTATAEAKQE